MNTLQLIYFICTNPHLTNIIIEDGDDRTPMHAIEFLSGQPSQDWKINSALEENTLFVY